MAWDQEFYDPICLPGRKKPLVTLRDAAEYIIKLPVAERDADEWQATMQALILVAEHVGPAMFARIGVMKALNRNAGAGKGSMTVTPTQGRAASCNIAIEPGTFRDRRVHSTEHVKIDPEKAPALSEPGQVEFSLARQAAGLGTG